MEQEITNMNRLIAEFMGGTPNPHDGGVTWTFDPTHIDGQIYSGDGWNILKYHTSWDWLMTAWKKAGHELYEMRMSLPNKEYLLAHHLTKEFMSACQTVNIKMAWEKLIETIEFINSQKEVGNE